MPDFDAILASDLFTFVLGPSAETLHIHSGVVKGVSEPLYKMMTNGMQESISHKAILEIVDRQTFKLFAEYAYTSTYCATPKETASLPLPSVAETPSKPRCCAQCGTTHVVSHQYAFGMSYVCTPEHCSDTRTQTTKENSRRCTRCGKRTDGALSFGGTSQESVCQCPNNPSRESTGVVSTFFATRQYPAQGMTADTFRKHLSTLTPPDPITDQVSCHARLYIFAECYMIEPLKEICLHKLHRDLVLLELTTVSAEEVVKLIDYTYEQTWETIPSKEGVLKEGPGQKLRELVCVYTAWKAKELYGYETFRRLLARGGEFVVEWAGLAVGKSNT